MLIPSNNNMITILAIKIEKAIKILKYLQKKRYSLIKKKNGLKKDISEIFRLTF
jgi:predicted GIY-YIG superfamily endonuclease